MNNIFTQESLGLFYNETIKGFIEVKEKINSQNETIKKLEDQVHGFVLQKAVENEKNEMLLYKMGVIKDKAISAEQKVNELNTIMMKHFAYKVPNTPSVTEPLRAPYTFQTNKS
jgi:hypothetical protein